MILYIHRSPGNIEIAESAKEMTIELYKKLIHSLEQALLKMSLNLDSFDQHIAEILSSLGDFLQCDLITYNDSGQDVINYPRVTELLYQVITWLFVCM